MWLLENLKLLRFYWKKLAALEALISGGNLNKDGWYVGIRSESFFFFFF
jgi:hypothetical protein